jgi:hypothetical protein
VNDSSTPFRKIVLRLHETDEARTDENPIVETEEAGNTTPLSLLNFSDIAEDHPGKVKGFIQHLKKQCGVLAENPRMGRARPELQKTLRSFPLSPYLIFYKALKKAFSSSTLSIEPEILKLCSDCLLLP